MPRKRHKNPQGKVQGALQQGAAEAQLQGNVAEDVGSCVQEAFQQGAANFQGKPPRKAKHKQVGVQEHGDLHAQQEQQHC
eukprot:735882-Prorocentrum_lima.AAC.1